MRQSSWIKVTALLSLILLGWLLFHVAEHSDGHAGDCPLCVVAGALVVVASFAFNVGLFLLGQMSRARSGRPAVVTIHSPSDRAPPML